MINTPQLFWALDGISKIAKVGGETYGKSGGELNPKYPGGIEEHKARLELEGHKVIQKEKILRREL